MGTDMDIDIVIEEYVNNFRNLLITLLKSKNKICVNNEKSKYNYCLHPNYKGKQCKRMVKKKGELCVFHIRKLNKNSNDLLDENFNLEDNYKEKNKSCSFSKNICQLDIKKSDNNLPYRKENNKKSNLDKNNNFNEINGNENKLLEIINLENNKLICYKCKKTLTTQKEITENICNYCNNFPSLSRNKTLVSCKYCVNNTININNVCNNCSTINNKKEYLKKCIECKINKVYLNQHLCNYCYKKQKRRIKVF